jgi:glycosyltransferase involved in cell wall biosynthesis
MRVAILDMQQIEPATGGGRARLLGLYHGLGAEVTAKYIGTYDYPGPTFRRHMLTETLEEINVPLTPEHFQACEAARDRLGGFNVIDLIFHKQGHLSPEYVAAAREATQEADVVVFSHPWIYPLVKDVIVSDRQLIVYDSHNVEAVLRASLLTNVPDAEDIVRGVAEIEAMICSEADLILACSQADRLQFSRVYGTPPEKIRIAPNGVFCSQIYPASKEQKAAARRRFELPSTPIALFLGSNYRPNVEAANFIVSTLAPRFPDVTFVIIGGVGEAIAEKSRVDVSANVRLTGQVAELDKRALLSSADIALNPMGSGSGTNVKMFDFMAAGLPILTTKAGARGIDSSEPAFLTCELADFEKALRFLLESPSKRERLAASARTEAERYYAWEVISDHLGTVLSHRRRAKAANSSPPLFSVIIPTYNRPNHLTRLMDLLAQQTLRDFEVVVIDQSEIDWDGRHLHFDLDLHYVRPKIRGAVHARNLGASLARGKILAFTDDDCEPNPNWLRAAADGLAEDEIVGLEGLVVSARLHDPDWRPVTNKHFRSFGFMTANLFVKARAFFTLNGFDVAFDNPHFREDTDLGWRLQALGQVPFSEAAWVFHPPHSRATDRESRAARVAFFEKDAILCAKHPQKYRALFFAEGHWTNTRGFWDNFARGARKYNVRTPAFIDELMPADRNRYGLPILGSSWNLPERAR